MKQVLLLLTITLTSVVNLYGQSGWDESSNPIKTTDDVKISGRLGIKTSDPKANVHIRAGILDSSHYLLQAGLIVENSEGRVQILSRDSDNAAAMLFLSNVPASNIGPNKHWNIHHTGSIRNDRLDIGYGTTTKGLYGDMWNLAPKFTILTNGNVGIATTTPASKLHVFGADNSFPQVRIHEDGGVNSLDLGHDGTNAQIKTNKGHLLLVGGSVGIGTTTPTEKLSVNGTIRSKEVKVEAAPWPDYVFATDYALPTLKETETFIQKNHRLPNMPSAEEVAENGIALGEMNRLLVEKVEELTLHMIQLEKENREMEKRFQELEKLIIAK